MGAELPPGVVPGPGLRLQHGGRGVIVTPATSIGARVSIFHRCTMGTRPPHQGAPRIEDDVKIGCDTRILGPVTVGPGARVGAGATVVKDVPAGRVALGPAAQAD